MYLALNSTSLQPCPPVQHPEGKGLLVHPMAWPWGMCLGGQVSQVEATRTLLGCQPSQAFRPALPSQSPSAAPLSLATDFGSEAPPWEHPLPPHPHFRVGDRTRSRGVPTCTVRKGCKMGLDFDFEECINQNCDM